MKPANPIKRRRPPPQLAQALAQRESPTIQEQCREIHARVEYLRKATYLICNKTYRV